LINTVQIREAKLSDLENLSDLFNSYRMFYGKKSDLKVANEFLRSRIENKDSKIFVCDLNNELSGFVQLYPIFSSTRVSKYWLLNDLFVDIEKRGKGYSKLLIDRSKELVIESKACGMMLETEKSNDIGNMLYPSTGFKKNKLSNFYEWVPN
tara:strand:- start:20 stop:475 length:456 start_codon:yes stop_codon:yes gene_type:complete